MATSFPQTAYPPPVAGRAFFALRIALGLFLTVSAALKFHAWVVDPVSADGLLGSPHWQLVLIEVELALAVWLFSGLAQYTASLVSVATFSVFACINLAQAISGQATCECFGRLSVNPWLTMGLDLAVLALMARLRPLASRTETHSLLTSSCPGAAPAGQPPSPWLRRVALAGFGLLLVGLTAWGWFRPKESLLTAVSFDQTSFDFGEVAQGQTLTHTFRLTNAWARPVEVVRIHSTCGCTTTGIAVGTVVPPGSSLEVPVELKPGMAEGPRSARLTLFYRDPGQMTPTWQTLEVSANVVVDYHVTPRVLEFGELGAQDSVTKFVRLTPDRLAGLKLSRMTVSPPLFEVREVPTATVEGGISVAVTADPGRFGLREHVSSVLEFETNSPHAPRAAILLKASRKPSVRVAPEAVIIGSDVRGTVEREIEIVTSTKTCLHVATDGLGLVLSPCGNVLATRHVVRVQVAETSAHALAGQMTVTISPEPGQTVPGPTEVSIPIYRFPAQKGRS